MDLDPILPSCIHLFFPSSVHDKLGSNHGWHASCVGNSLGTDLFIALLVVTYVVDVDGLLHAVLDTCENTADIGFPNSTWTKASRVWQESFEELNWHYFLSVKVDWVSPQESNIFQAFHVSQVGLTKSHKEANTFDTWNVFSDSISSWWRRYISF